MGEEANQSESVFFVREKSDRQASTTNPGAIAAKAMTLDRILHIQPSHEGASATFGVVPGELPGATGTDPAVEFHSLQVTMIKSEMRELHEEVDQLRDIVTKKVEAPTTLAAKIYSLPSDEYALKTPIDIILEMHSDECLALMPEFSLYGEGTNEIEAIGDLKAELMELIDDIRTTPDHKLGRDFLIWKKALRLVVE